ncbi:MAG: transposase [Sandaracinaceae bacterium]|nr:transposase [Sandaracinaceae bacterium]
MRVPHGTLKHNDPCPKCDKGKLYRKKPSVLIRVRGVAPLNATRYELERLRCNLCGAVFVADTPPRVGEAKYDASAAAMIALMRYGCGLPHNRLARLGDDVGLPMPSATQWDVIASISTAFEPVHDELVRVAAQGDVLHNDDTNAMVLSLDAMIREEIARGDNDRTGIFTSGIVSKTGVREIVLFFTGREHAGENLKKVLDQRSPDLSPPIQMCDALARNSSPDFDAIVAHCMAHARRHFVDVVHSFPIEVAHVLEELRKVFVNEAFTKKERMSDEQRLLYHQEHSGPVMAELGAWLSAQLRLERALTPQARPRSALPTPVQAHLAEPLPRRRALRYPDAAVLPSRGTGSALSGADYPDYTQPSAGCERGARRARHVRGRPAARASPMRWLRSSAPSHLTRRRRLPARLPRGRERARRGEPRLTLALRSQHARAMREQSMASTTRGSVPADRPLNGGSAVWASSRTRVAGEVSRGRSNVAALLVCIAASALLSACAAGEPTRHDGGESRDVGEPSDARDASPTACRASAECSDSIACTIDECTDATCAHRPCIDCCEAPLTCVLGVGCTRPPRACTTDADCADGVRCTLDACSAGFCTNMPQDALCSSGEICRGGCIPARGACSTVDDCIIARPCDGQWQCVVEFGCEYLGPTSCDDGDACTADSCVDPGGCTHTPTDVDADGHAPVSCGGADCDDADPAIHPGAAEVCDGADNDCDTAIDESVCIPCPSGFSGRDGDCTDIDECAMGLCGAAATGCSNTPGSYACTCAAGYTAPPTGGTCEDVDECTTAVCGTAALDCTNTPGSYVCACMAGYAAPAMGGTCADVDECSTAPCGSGGTSCTNTTGSYVCTCMAGYSAPAMGGTCADVDECATGICGPQAAGCANTPGSYACTCMAGYTAPPLGGMCTLTDACAAGGTDCDTDPAAACASTGGATYTCTCPPDFVGTGHGSSGCLLADPSLISLVPSAGSLDPAFASGTTTYRLGLPPGATTVTLTPTVSHPTHATITIDGATVASGAPSAPIALTGFAPRLVSVTVTTDSGAVRTYTVTVVRTSVYIKASNTDVGDRFGSLAIALSADGSTLAVAAEGEGSSARGVGGDPADNGASGSGAVYVFVRSASGVGTAGVHQGLQHGCI